MKKYAAYIAVAFIFFVLLVITTSSNRAGEAIHSTISTATPLLIATTTTSKPSVNGQTKKIYLTMDMDINEWMYQKHLQGKMSDWYDPNVFDYLLQNNIPATFFVSGLFAQTYPGLIEQLNLTGKYTFQNHSYDESSFTPNCYELQALLNDQQKTFQIEETQSILKILTGRAPTQFRFPGDCHSPSDDQLVENLGFTINSGTIIAGDPFNNNTTPIVQNILSQAKNNSIILMHIGGPNAPKDLQVLEMIVPTLEKEGYIFEKIN